VYTWSEKLELQRPLELDAFQHCHPTFANFLVGNLLIATLVQAPSSSSNASNPCFLLEDKRIDASLRELHSTESIFSHIWRSCRRYALPSNNQRASIRMYYKRTCSDIGTSSNRCRNQYHPACLLACRRSFPSGNPPSSTHYTNPVFVRYCMHHFPAFHRDGKQRHFLPD
jgi:hypothetical protein